jgi:hypothetical protein
LSTELLLRLLDLGVGTISLLATVIMAVVLLKMVRVITFALEGQQASDSSEQAERKGLIGMIETLIVKFANTLDALNSAFETSETLAQKRFAQAMDTMGKVPDAIHTLQNDVTETKTTSLNNHKLLEEFRGQLEALKESIGKLPTSEEFNVQKSQIQTLITRVEADCLRLETAITHIETLVKEEKNNEPGQSIERTGNDHQNGIGHRGTYTGAAGERLDPGHDRSVHHLADQVGTSRDQVESTDLRPTKGDHPSHPGRSNRLSGVAGLEPETG